jgi:hypothetical protein
MKTLKTLVPVLSFLLIFSACKKSKNDEPQVSPLVGTWKLVNVQANTSVSFEASSGGTTEKVVTTSNYTSINNKGVYEFTADKVFGKGIGYQIDAVANVKFYENNILYDSYDEPFDYLVPPTDLNSPYTVKGDSVTFTNKNFNGIDFDGIGSTYKYTISGPNLVLNGKFLKIGKEDVGGGIIADSKYEATVVINLLKQ